MKSLSRLWIVTSLLTGCASTSFTPTPTLLPTAETPNPLPEPSDPTQLITVALGETFELVLPSNPSTGYHWNFLGEPDVNLFELVSQDYIAEQPTAIGSGGVEVWTFRAVSAGDTTLVLGYYPPTNASELEEVVTFSIHVE
jgi:inhibitor of cysteine peptidase